MLTREEINRPYKNFYDHIRVTAEGRYVSLGEIVVLSQAKGCDLEGLFRRGMLIQHPTKLDHFRVSP